MNLSFSTDDLVVALFAVLLSDSNLGNLLDDSGTLARTAMLLLGDESSELL